MGKLPGEFELKAGTREISVAAQHFAEERLRLDVVIRREEAEVARYRVLNDLVINKGALARIVDQQGEPEEDRQEEEVTP